MITGRVSMVLPECRCIVQALRPTLQTALSTLHGLFCPLSHVTAPRWPISPDGLSATLVTGHTPRASGRNSTVLYRIRIFNVFACMGLSLMSATLPQAWISPRSDVVHHQTVSSLLAVSSSSSSPTSIRCPPIILNPIRVVFHSICRPGDGSPSHGL